MSKNNAARRRLDFAQEGEPAVSNPHKKNKTANENDAKEATLAVTPETGIEKFLTRNKSNDSKPKAARKLVTPLKEDQRKPSTHEESDSTLYYQSGDEEQEAIFKPTHVHKNVDYHRRGDLALDQKTLKVYRFIRNHFLIPSAFEVDHKFGPLSGSCFEERVIRAYSLGELLVKEGIDKSSLLVCTYCSEEGHLKDSCSELL